MIGHTGSGVVYVGDGRVLARGTAPCLKRFAGVKEKAFRAIAKERGWSMREDTLAAAPAIVPVAPEARS